MNVKLTCVKCLRELKLVGEYEHDSDVGHTVEYECPFCHFAVELDFTFSKENN
jgi:hypothetical protein